MALKFSFNLVLKYDDLDIHIYTYVSRIYYYMLYVLHTLQRESLHMGLTPVYCLSKSKSLYLRTKLKE